MSRVIRSKRDFLYEALAASAYYRAMKGLIVSRGAVRAACLVALLSLPAAAQSADVVAIHPLVVIDAAGAEADGYRHAYSVAASKPGFTTVEPDRVHAFLGSQPGGVCENSAACLTKLAKATKATHVLYATLAAYAGKSIVLTGKLVRADGVVLRDEPVTFALQGRNRRDVLKDGVKSFFARFDPATVPVPLVMPVKPEETPKPVVTVTPKVETQPNVGAPPVTPGPKPAEGFRAPGWMLPVGIGAAAVGVVGIVGGLYFQGKAQADYKTLQGYYSSSPFPPSTQHGTLASLWSSASSEAAVGNAGIVSGTIFLVAGAGLLTTALIGRPGATPVALSLGPTSVQLTALWQ